MSESLSDLHAELRGRNLRVLTWSAAVFNTAYLSWSGFDYVLAPDRWREFLVYRLLAVALNTAIVLCVRRPRWRHYTWEAFWAWLFVFGGFIALMLPVVGDAHTPYIMGFTLILYGAGLLPLWPPRWAISNVGAILAAASLTIVFGSPTVSARDLMSSAFFVFTGAGLAIVMAVFKYEQAKRDFARRQELACTSADLGKALERLRELDQLKSRFFANVSHELRTPLTLIMAPLDELARDLALSPHQHTIRVVRSNARRLLRLIDELLELSRLDAGGLRLNLSEVDLRTIASGACENGSAAATAAGIELTFSADPSTRRIFADAHRLEIVATNLVGNALKYTPDGGRVEVSVRDVDAGVVLEVRDTGPGIPRELLERVFDRFFQVTSGQQGGERRRQGGVGIGLALAKELVELHGGHIEVDSEPGQGTTFRAHFRFGRAHIRSEVIERRQAFRPDESLARRSEDPAPGPAAPVVAHRGGAIEVGGGGLGRARIVVAEDNDDLRDFISRLLSEHEVLPARDGAEALEIVAREQPDLVVSDVMMPRMSGGELCVKIKQDPALARIPVILLTARAGSDATLEGFSWGADDFVTKPFHPHVLVARIQVQLRLRQLGLKLAQKEKLAVVGTLAAGVLHELRNPVNALLNAGRVLADNDTDHEMAARLRDVIEDSAARIHAITEALDTHAHPAEVGRALFDVRTGLEATLALLAHRLGDVTIHRDYDDVPDIEAVPARLNQVFLNLVDNALRAGARHLWLRVRAAGNGLEVRVGDDGPGVPPQIAARVFDPFFTTRPAGEGTGLGLYISRQIVAEEAGELRLETRPGGGAELIVALPGKKETR